MRVLFAIEAGAEVGLGHLMRCRALMLRLSAAGAEIELCVLGDVRALGERAWPTARPVTVAPSGNGPEKFKGLLSDRLREARYDWLVLDGHGLRRMSFPDGPRTLVVDDLGDQPLRATAVLNQNVERPDPYDQRGFEVNDRLLGPRFALLDAAYADAEWKGSGAAGLERLLVSFGGADRPGWSGKALAALASCASPLTIDLVVGPLHSQDHVSGRIGGGHRLVVHRSPDGLAPLMAAADAMVASASVTSWEACCVGVPLIALQTAANQVHVLTSLDEAGAAITARAEEALDGGAKAKLPGLMQRIESLAVRRDLSARQRSLVDGRGAERVAAYMTGRIEG
jgi:spore coat polysaccharide biosynthesis predicted glycosyltransferase SpsG